MFVVTTSEPELTTALNDTWWNSTQDDAMLDVTTDVYTTDFFTTSVPMEDLGPHPPFAHQQCVARNDRPPESYERRLSSHGIALLF